MIIKNANLMWWYVHYKHESNEAIYQAHSWQFYSHSILFEKCRYDDIEGYSYTCIIFEWFLSLLWFFQQLNKNFKCSSWRKIMNRNSNDFLIDTELFQHNWFHLSFYSSSKNQYFISCQLDLMSSNFSR